MRSEAERRKIAGMTAFVLLSAIVAGSATYAPAPGALDNPLKGWAPYAETGSQVHRPHSMFYTYAKWRELEPQEGKYSFQEWENRAWETPLAKGKHVVFRVFLDYPTQPTGVPQWLVDSGLEMKPYTDHGGGKSPDYANPKLRAGMLKLIAALGKRYNSHPRVAFVQIGMLGHWGEWHTYPRADLFPDEAFQMEVLQAFRKAFPDKQLMARNPASVAGKLPWIGYHDDMIPFDTLGPDEWMFLPAMKTNGRLDNWKVAPVGGEMVPGEAKKYMGAEYGTLNRAIDEARVSWMGPYCPAHVEGDSEFLKRCDEAVRRMGYDFRWESGEWTSTVRAGGQVGFSLQGANIGVAPFYYPWRVEAAILDASGKVVGKSAVVADIRKWLPGPIRLQGSAKAPVAPGRYTLGVGIVDPYRNAPGIRFANAAAPIGGYFPVGEIEVR